MKGRKTGGGSRKGIPNKVTQQIKEAITEAFDRLGGVDHLTAWAEANPTEYYRLASRLIPHEVRASITEGPPYTLADVTELLAELRRVREEWLAECAIETVTTPCLPDPHPRR